MYLNSNNPIKSFMLWKRQVVKLNETKSKFSINNIQVKSESAIEKSFDASYIWNNVFD